MKTAKIVVNGKVVYTATGATDSEAAEAVKLKYAEEMFEEGAADDMDDALIYTDHDIETLDYMNLVVE